MDFSELKETVANVRGVVSAATTLIAGLAQRLRDAIDNDDQEELDSIVTELENSAAELGEAVAANTPSAGDSPAEPVDSTNTDNGGQSDADILDQNRLGETDED